ncbi:SGNH/GDSL hydrolase family protein [Paenibacillus sp. PL91]|uniref:SGNH/GDSL hydrolase family protein n=1 Tax=Paenibacillus sp. PL91 TaxID=2729538 RepID=UPI00145F7162|nr:SGNH/GDSL hydrolase family protein [Paenibacillus sp. PL91]MBC9202996.1 SGNH/GDSL hydrolase family protein [Paenibacillus sp. PL91]
MRKLDQSGSNYMKLRSGLPNLGKKLYHNEPIVVAFFGGSITEGYGASDPDKTSWRAWTESYLMERFSAEKVTCINAGVGGTNSTFGAHRLKEHALQSGEMDLLFVEFSVNDGEDREESIRGMEGIVRQCRRLSPKADICFIYTAAEKNLSARVPFNIAVHEEVAAYYQLPSVNFAASIYDRIEAGQTRWEELAPDLVHPNDAGYALYAQYVRHFLEEALASYAERGFAPRKIALPVPLDDRNFERAAMLDLNQVSQQEGFSLMNIQPEPLINWRYPAEHLFTDREGASLSFAVNGRSAGILLLCGPDTGIFEYSLNGLTFNQVQLFDDWCLGAYRPVIAMFPLPEEEQIMQITVRNTSLKDGRSTGTCLRILRIFSNE